MSNFIIINDGCVLLLSAGERIDVAPLPAGTAGMG